LTPESGAVDAAHIARKKRDFRAVYGASRARTGDLLGAIQALSQLSYSPLSASRRSGARQQSLVGEQERAGAVWFAGAMGLLDDAIRDHLELKRLRGADPGEVAREQHEALDAGSEDMPAGEDGGLATSLESPDSEADHESAPLGATPAVELLGPMAPGDPDPGSPGAPDPEGANVGQETAELDMQSLLDDQTAAGPEHDSTEGTAGAGSTENGPSEGVHGEDALEGDVPGELTSDTRAGAGEHNQAVGGAGP
jgi:hypothetical protein